MSKKTQRSEDDLDICTDLFSRIDREIKFLVDSDPNCTAITVINLMCVKAISLGLKDLDDFKDELYLYLWERRFNLPFVVKKPKFIREFEHEI